MPVIIREKREVGGKIQVVKIYKTDRLLTREAKQQAEKLDSLLAKKMNEIENELEKNGLLKLKGSRGVIKLWYQVGKQLSFVADPTIVSMEDQKYIWRALYDHTKKITPGSGRSRMQQYERNHFHYCFLLAQFDWDFVVSAGNWRSWVEFFDSEKIRVDPRIIKWLSLRSKQKATKEWENFASRGKQRLFRRLTREIRQNFKQKDTSVFSTAELFEKLDHIFSKVFRSELA
jgi:hypothetical protein